jgi:Tetracyclin repressor-like, C-terminal domain
MTALICPRWPTPWVTHRGAIRVADLELAAFVCVTSIEALTHTAVLHRKILSDIESESLIEETTRLIVGYLTR